MFTLVKSTSNNIVCTLTEKQTLTNPYYLFVFTDEVTKINYACIAADISLYPERYNNFTIIETTTPNALNGEIELVNTGFYSYVVYEQHSSTNLDPLLADGTLEIGKMKLLATASTIETYNSQPTSVKVYQS